MAKTKRKFREKYLKDCFHLIPHGQKGFFFSLSLADFIQYIGNFPSLSAKVGKTTISGQIRDFTENNYLLGI